jgi:hypothetical protein
MELAAAVRLRYLGETSPSPSGLILVRRPRVAGSAARLDWMTAGLRTDQNPTSRNYQGHVALHYFLFYWGERNPIIGSCDGNGRTMVVRTFAVSIKYIIRCSEEGG